MEGKVVMMRMPEWIAVAVMWGVLGGCDGGQGQSVPTFNPCAGDEDCSELTPDCRSVDAMGTGNPVSRCTRVCSLDGPPCYVPGGFEGGTYGPCLGVNEDGQPDEDADERLCFHGCDVVGSTCVLGATDEHLSRCALLDYGDQGGVVACVDDVDGE
jgi:hypothetical protein